MGRIGVVVGVLALAGLIVTGAFILSSAGFSAGTMDRDATIEVATDEDGFVGLLDGNPTSGFVTKQSDGTLGIDFTAGGAGGANEDAMFVLGDPNDPVADHAFRIVNRDSRAHDVTIGYDLASNGGEASGPDSLTFEFFHDVGGDQSVDGDPSYSISENTGSNQATATNVGSGEVVYVVVTVDTTGLSSSEDLSGTLNVSVGSTA